MVILIFYICIKLVYKETTFAQQHCTDCYKEYMATIKIKCSPLTGSGISGISKGAIAGIVIGAIIVVCVVAFGMVFLKRQGTFDKVLGKGVGAESNGDLGFDNALYSNTQQAVNIDPTKHGNGINGASSSFPGEEDA